MKSEYLELYGKERLNSDVVSLALEGTNDNRGTSYNTLKETIKVYGGLIAPVIVKDKDFIVLEGNSRFVEYRLQQRKTL